MEVLEMDLFESDLQAFANDWRLADQAVGTVQGYVKQLRKYHWWCEARGVQTLSTRQAKTYLIAIPSS